MTRPHGHPLGSVAATLALSDWERRTALAAPDYDPDETEYDDPGADVPERVAGWTIPDMTNEGTPMSQPTKYRKKPVVIEAMQFDGTNGEEVAAWCGGVVSSATCHGDGPPWLVMIRTLEGTMAAGRDDYVIRGVQGEFYPCKPDTFEASYEREASLADVVSDMQMQRHLDNEPCTTCGGDRLRPDFVNAGRCHVGATTTGATR